MTSFRTGVVDRLVERREGLQRVTVDGEPAYVVTSLVGEVAAGDPVVVNTTAVELGLGTGGSHVVHWNLARDALRQPGSGHVMKLRYTSLQADVGSAEEHDPAPPGPAGTDLGGLAVAVAGLHSLVGPIVAGALARRPELRIGYVMTDDAALPLALSDLVARLVDAQMLATTVTAGQAFGGAHEAVTVPSALWTCRHRLGLDAVVVAMGPGNVGTGTPLGTSALGQVPVIDLTGRLGGRAVVALRHSGADTRTRHRGLSHHSKVALELSREPATIAVAARWAGEVGAELDRADVAHHRRRVVDAPEVLDRLDAIGAPFRSMGRPGHHDRRLVDAAAAAGAVLAAEAGHRG